MKSSYLAHPGVRGWLNGMHSNRFIFKVFIRHHKPCQQQNPTPSFIFKIQWYRASNLLDCSLPDLKSSQNIYHSIYPSYRANFMKKMAVSVC